MWFGEPGTEPILSHCNLQQLSGARPGESGHQAAQADLLLCLARLVRGAPPAAVRAQHAQLLPWVLAALQDAKVGADEQAVTALLLTVSEALMDPAGAHALQKCRASVVYTPGRPPTSRLCSCKPTMPRAAVPGGALQYLEVCMHGACYWTWEGCLVYSLNQKSCCVSLQARR